MYGRSINLLKILLSLQNKINLLKKVPARLVFEKRGVENNFMADRHLWQKGELSEILNHWMSLPIMKKNTYLFIHIYIYTHFLRRCNITN